MAGRIVTKNLLISALRAMSGDRRRRVRESNVRDLCTLITLSMLYDELETLGSQHELDARHKPSIASEYAEIRKVTKLRIAAGPEPADFDRVLNSAIPFATKPFLRAGTDTSLSDLRTRLNLALREGTSDRPDYWEDLVEGERLLTSKRSKIDPEDAERFVLRSFLYAGLASFRGWSLVPDSVRSHRPEWASAPQIRYGERLEEAVNRKFDSPLVGRVSGLTFSVPPFAAAVFIRAGNDRRNIAREIWSLRDELSSVRAVLSAVQSERDSGADYGKLVTIFGGPGSKEAETRVDERVNAAIAAVQRARIPLPPQLSFIRSVFDLATTAFSFVDNVTSPHKLIKLKALLDTREMLESLVDTAEWSQRSAFLEVHNQLGWTLRSWSREGVDFERLFGKILPDGPAERT